MNKRFNNLHKEHMKSTYRKYENVTDLRKRTMSRIHSKDTNCELLLRHALWHYGYRYRKNYIKLPGSPDICITKYKVAIFCDSDYFHGKDWDKNLRNKVSKGNNSDYWLKKIQTNIERDKKIDAQLRGLGWTVLHFWATEIMKNPAECVNEINDMVKDISE